MSMTSVNIKNKMLLTKIINVKNIIILTKNVKIKNDENIALSKNELIIYE